MEEMEDGELQTGICSWQMSSDSARFGPKVSFQIVLDQITIRCAFGSGLRNQEVLGARGIR